jgi:hypothetical protein
MLLAEFLSQENLVFFRVRPIRVFVAEVGVGYLASRFVIVLDVYWLFVVLMDYLIHLFDRILGAGGRQCFELYIPLHFQGWFRCIIVALCSHSNSLCSHLQHLDFTRRTVRINNRIYLQRRYELLRTLYLHSIMINIR